MAMNWVDQGGYLTNNKLSMDFYKTAQPKMKYRQFVSVKEAFGKQAGQSVNFMKVGNVNNYGKKIAETNVMPETNQTLTWGTVTVTEFGNSIPFSFKMETLSEFQIKEIMREGLQDDMVKVVEGTVEREFNKTPRRYVGITTTSSTVTTNSTAGAANTSALNSFHTRKMRLELEKLNCPTWEGDDYVFVGSIEAIESLEGAMETVNSYTETGYKKILNGEVGRLWGVRFVKDYFASRNVFDPDAGTATAIAWATAVSGVGYMFGKPTVMEIITVPEEIRLKVTTDYGRSKGIGWYMLGNWGIIRDDVGHERIIKWDSTG